MKRRICLGMVGGLGCAVTLARPGAGFVAGQQRVLIVLTNTARVPGSDRPTGVWALEFTDPYVMFMKAGLSVVVAAPRGGVAPIDPRTGSADRVKAVCSAWEKMQATPPLAQSRLDDHAGVFLPGGHGTMWDFPDDAALKSPVERAFARGVPLGAVCQGAAGGRFESPGVFRCPAAVDGMLVTGQNPASADAVSDRMVELMGARSR
jgi:putative intracellular protease/amidase